MFFTVTSKKPNPRKLRDGQGKTLEATQVADTLTLIRASFPGRDELIATAFRENRSFRQLCEDYRRCLAAVHHWKQLQEKQNPPRWQEFSELLVELGGEIQTWLAAMDPELPHLGRGRP